MSRLLFASLCAICVSAGHAGTIDLNGSITGIFEGGRALGIATSPGDTFAEGDPYTMHLLFDGSFSGPGDFTLTAMTLIFDGGTASEFQNHFDSASVSISQTDEGELFTLLACASINEPCFDGNRLDIDFIIPAESTLFDNFKPGILSDVPPMGLLEGGARIVDFIGTVDNFSYTSATPEPSSLVLAALGVSAVILKRRR